MAAIQSGSSCHTILQPDGIRLAAKAVAYLPEHCLHSVAYLQLSSPPRSSARQRRSLTIPHVKRCYPEVYSGFHPKSLPPSNPSAPLKDLDNRKSSRQNSTTAQPATGNRQFAHEFSMGDERFSSSRRLNEPSVTGLSVLVEPERPTLE